MAQTLDFLGAASNGVVATVNDDRERYRCELRLWSLEDGTLLHQGPAPTTFGGHRAPGARALLVCPSRSELLLAADTRLEIIALPGGERTKLGGIPRNTGPISTDYAREGDVFGVVTHHHVKIWDAE